MSSVQKLPRRSLRTFRRRNRKIESPQDANHPVRSACEREFASLKPTVFPLNCGSIVEQFAVKKHAVNEKLSVKRDALAVEDGVFYIFEHFGSFMPLKKQRL
jgi:hypothetical protein